MGGSGTALSRKFENEGSAFPDLWFPGELISMNKTKLTASPAKALLQFDKGLIIR
jgi:hypothetical protein